MTWKLSEIRMMAGVSEKVEFRAGETIFRQGEVGDRVFLVRRGLVEIYAETSGRKRRLNLRGRGEVIGEMALIDGLGRSATAVACTRVQALSLDRTSFARLLQERPSLYYNLTLSLSHRLRELQGTLGTELDRRDEKGKGAGLSQLGPYLLFDQLGEGGGGVVYRGEHRQNRQARAVKVMPISNEDQRVRFLRECETMARMIHPNITRIESSGLEGYYGYLSMELLQGETLEQRLERGPLSQAEIRKLILPAMSALQYAHDVGVTHRDVKPGNLFVTLDGSVRLLDFGVAKRVTGPELTVAGRFFGTPKYLAPERIGGQSRSHERESDQYSMGIVLYEAISGRCPFAQEDVADVLASHLHRQPAFPLGASPALGSVILRMLAKEPGKRYPNFEAAAQALEEALVPSASTLDLRVPKDN